MRMSTEVAATRTRKRMRALLLVTAPDGMGLLPKGLQYFVSACSTSLPSCSLSTMSLSTNPASNPRSAMRAAFPTRVQEKPPYLVKLRKSPEQKRKGHTKKKWRRVRSR